MAVDRSADPACQAGRQQADGRRPRGNHGIMYILSTGCQWAALPKDLPPRSTVNDYFRLWDWNGTLERIHHALYVQCREQAAREGSPTAAIIDSQSVKSAEKGGARLICPAMMQQRRSRERNATSLSIHKAS